MESWGLTDIGKVRSQNQDAFYLTGEGDASPFRIVVCDGMGGARAGNVASEMAVAVFRTEAERLLSDKMTAEEAAKTMKDIAATVNTAVYDLSESRREYKGMGTTMVAAALLGDELAVINIGDSRAYHITVEDITRITRDHSVVEDMVERGDITREESLNHPNKNLITRAVGTSPYVLCDAFTRHLGDGEYILLCSDGLSNTVMDWELQFEVTHSQSAREACERLLALALDRGAPDNVTVALAKK